MVRAHEQDGLHLQLPFDDFILMFAVGMPCLVTCEHALVPVQPASNKTELRTGQFGPLSLTL
jgi:hypothetical protein